MVVFHLSTGLTSLVQGHLNRSTSVGFELFNWTRKNAFFVLFVLVLPIWSITGIGPLAMKDVNFDHVREGKQVYGTGSLLQMKRFFQFSKKWLTNGFVIWTLYLML